jgi:hypothetical protein
MVATLATGHLSRIHDPAEMNSAAFEDLAERARARLLDAGFVVAEERGPEALGNRLIQFERDALRVWATLDRGQAFLSLTSRGLDGRWDIGLWQACLGATAPSLEVREFEADLDWLLVHLRDIEELAATDTSVLEECLRVKGTWRFNSRRERGMIQPPR